MILPLEPPKKQPSLLAAKAAAEDTVQYSLDEERGHRIENKAQEVYDLVSSLELGSVKEDVSYIKIQCLHR